MFDTEQLPGKRFLLAIQKKITQKNKKRKVSCQYLSGVICCCLYPPTTQSLQELKLVLQYDDANGKFETIKPYKTRKLFLVEHLIVKVPSSTQRLIALLFLPLSSQIYSNETAYLQYFGTKYIVKVSNSKSFQPYKFTHEITSEEKRETRGKKLTLSQLQMEDFLKWLRVLKTRLFLQGPYAIPPCPLFVYNDSGQKRKATVKNHDVMSKKLTIVFDDKTIMVDPNLHLIEFDCTDDGLDDMLNGLTPKLSRHNQSYPKTFKPWSPPSWCNLTEEYKEAFQRVKCRIESQNNASQSSRMIRSRSSSSRSQSSSSSMSVSNVSSTTTKTPVPDYLSVLNSDFSPTSRISRYLDITDFDSVSNSSLQSPCDLSCEIESRKLLDDDVFFNNQPNSDPMSKKDFRKSSSCVQSVNTDSTNENMDRIESDTDDQDVNNQNTLIIDKESDVGDTNETNKIKPNDEIPTSRKSRYLDITDFDRSISLEVSTISKSATLSKSVDSVEGERKDSQNINRTPTFQSHFHGNEAKEEVAESEKSEEDVSDVNKKTTEKVGYTEQRSSLNQLELLSLMYESPQKFSPQSEIEEEYKEENRVQSPPSNTPSSGANFLSPESTTKTKEPSDKRKLHDNEDKSNWDKPPLLAPLNDEINKIGIQVIVSPSKPLKIASVSSDGIPLDSQMHLRETPVINSDLLSQQIFELKSTPGESSTTITKNSISSSNKGAEDHAEVINTELALTAPCQSTKSQKLSIQSINRTTDSSNATVTSVYTISNSIISTMERKSSGLVKSSPFKTSQNMCIVQPFNYQTPNKSIAGQSGVPLTTSQTNQISASSSIGKKKKTEASKKPSWSKRGQESKSNNGRRRQSAEEKQRKTALEIEEILKYSPIKSRNIFSTSSTSTTKVNSAISFTQSGSSGIASFTQSQQQVKSRSSSQGSLLPPWAIFEGREFQYVVSTKKGDSAFESIVYLQNFLIYKRQAYDQICEFMSPSQKFFFDKTLNLVSKLPVLRQDERSDVYFDVHDQTLQWEIIYKKLVASVETWVADAQKLKMFNPSYALLHNDVSDFTQRSSLFLNPDSRHYQQQQPPALNDSTNQQHQPQQSTRNRNYSTESCSQTQHSSHEDSAATQLMQLAQRVNPSKTSVPENVFQRNTSSNDDKTDLDFKRLENLLPSGYQIDSNEQTHKGSTSTVTNTSKDNSMERLPQHSDNCSDLMPSIDFELLRTLVLNENTTTNLYYPQQNSQKQHNLHQNLPFKQQQSNQQQSSEQYSVQLQTSQQQKQQQHNQYHIQSQHTQSNNDQEKSNRFSKHQEYYHQVSNQSLQPSHHQQSVQKIPQNPQQQIQQQQQDTIQEQQTQQENQQRNRASQLDFNNQNVPQQNEMGYYYGEAFQNFYLQQHEQSTKLHENPQNQHNRAIETTLWSNTLTGKVSGSTATLISTATEYGHPQAENQRHSSSELTYNDLFNSNSSIISTIPEVDKSIDRTDNVCPTSSVSSNFQQSFFSKASSLQSSEFNDINNSGPQNLPKSISGSLNLTSSGKDANLLEKISDKAYLDSLSSALNTLSDNSQFSDASTSTNIIETTFSETDEQRSTTECDEEVKQEFNEMVKLFLEYTSKKEPKRKKRKTKTRSSVIQKTSTTNETSSDTEGCVQNQSPKPRILSSRTAELSKNKDTDEKDVGVVSQFDSSAITTQGQWHQTIIQPLPEKPTKNSRKNTISSNIKHDAPPFSSQYQLVTTQTCLTNELITSDNAQTISPRKSVINSLEEALERDTSKKQVTNNKKKVLGREEFCGVVKMIDCNDITGTGRLFKTIDVSNEDLLVNFLEKQLNNKSSFGLNLSDVSPSDSDGSPKKQNNREIPKRILPERGDRKHETIKNTSIKKTVLDKKTDEVLMMFERESAVYMEKDETVPSEIETGTIEASLFCNETVNQGTAETSIFFNKFGKEKDQTSIRLNDHYNFDFTSISSPKASYLIKDLISATRDPVPHFNKSLLPMYSKEIISSQVSVIPSNKSPGIFIKTSCSGKGLSQVPVIPPNQSTGTLIKTSCSGKGLSQVPVIPLNQSTRTLIETSGLGKSPKHPVPLKSAETPTSTVIISKIFCISTSESKQPVNSVISTKASMGEVTKQPTLKASPQPVTSVTFSKLSNLAIPSVVIPKISTSSKSSSQTSMTKTENHTVKDTLQTCPSVIIPKVLYQTKTSKQTADESSVVKTSSNSKIHSEISIDPATRHSPAVISVSSRSLSQINPSRTSSVVTSSTVIVASSATASSKLERLTIKNVVNLAIDPISPVVTKEKPSIPTCHSTRKPVYQFLNKSKPVFSSSLGTNPLSVNTNTKGNLMKLLQENSNKSIPTATIVKKPVCTISNTKGMSEKVGMKQQVQVSGVSLKKVRRSNRSSVENTQVRIHLCQKENTSDASDTEEDDFALSNTAAIQMKPTATIVMTSQETSKRSPIETSEELPITTIKKSPIETTEQSPSQIEKKSSTFNLPLSEFIKLTQAKETSKENPKATLKIPYFNIPKLSMLRVAKTESGSTKLVPDTVPSFLRNINDKPTLIARLKVNQDVDKVNTGLQIKDSKVILHDCSSHKIPRKSDDSLNQPDKDLPKKVDEVEASKHTIERSNLNEPVAKRQKKKKRCWYPKPGDGSEDSPVEIQTKRKQATSGESLSTRCKKYFFLQKKSCRSYPSDLPRCLDCNQEGESDVGRNDENELTCRFTMFRRLVKWESGNRITSAGFSTTECAEDHDLIHWRFQDNTTIDLETCQKILVEIGAQFEQLVLQEMEAYTWQKNSVRPAWKRAVLRVREMCDLCATTIFNTHWTCEECGLGVCLDCFFARFKKEGKKIEWSECEATGNEHKPKDLRVTQIIPKNLLQDLYDDLLKTCDKIGLKMNELDLLEFSHHRSSSSSSLMKSNMTWREDPLAAKGAINNIIQAFGNATPPTPSECSWYCDGRMLHIKNVRFSDEAMSLFQSEWTRGKPILVSNVHENLNQELWTPESFERDFGDELNDVVNCFDGSVMEKLPIREFWRGFEKIRERPKSKEPVSLLKLKDWPPGSDFKDILPNRFNDIMQALPAPSYTHRNGELNLSARLPDFFAVPDLGPKMYNAYGSASYPSAGTTNLHLDISDATNTIAYVGIPDEEEFREEEEKDTLATVDAACCEATRIRIREPSVRPGALWHIFPAHSADKIRQFLNRVSFERGNRINPSSDPIHDQAFYLDQPLLDRLREEEGVQGYAICQCLGDAIFIPAGAPHQVLNLHSCIKVAEDFVAPEHISHCFQLTQEFRHLSDYHTNHEDKLQIKNIIYHAVKDCLGVVKKHYGLVD